MRRWRWQLWLFRACAGTPRCYTHSSLAMWILVNKCCAILYIALPCVKGHTGWLRGFVLEAYLIHSPRAAVSPCRGPMLTLSCVCRSSHLVPTLVLNVLPNTQIREMQEADRRFREALRAHTQQQMDLLR